MGVQNALAKSSLHEDVGVVDALVDASVVAARQKIVAFDSQGVIVGKRTSSAANVAAQRKDPSLLRTARAAVHSCMTVPAVAGGV